MKQVMTLISDALRPKRTGVMGPGGWQTESIFITPVETNKKHIIKMPGGRL